MTNQANVWQPDCDDNPQNLINIFVANYQALRDYTGTELTLYARGKLTAGDGGQDFYQKITNQPVGTFVDNNTNLIVPTGGDGSEVWLKRYDEIEILDFVPDPNEASAGMNLAGALALATGKKLVARDESVTLRLSAGVVVDWELITDFWLDSPIDTTDLDSVITTGCILLGNLANETGGHWKFPRLLSSNVVGANGATPFPQVRINGTKSIRMDFFGIKYLQFFQTDEITDVAGGRRANAYNAIYLNGERVGLFEVTGTTRVSDAVWFNENKIYGGRIYKTFFIDKGYIHNHNYFYNPLFEDAEFELKIETGSSNQWLGVRMENIGSSAGIAFGDTTDNNIVERGWISSLTPRETVLPAAFGIPFTDTGKNNQVFRGHLTIYNKREVLNFSANQVIVTDDPSVVGGSSASYSLENLNNERHQASTDNRRPVIPCHETIVAPFGFTRLAETGLIPVDNYAIFSVEATIRAGFWRHKVVVYDSDGVLLDEATALNAPTLSFTAGIGWVSTDLISSTLPLSFNINSSNVAYISIVISTGSVVDTVIESINAHYYEPPNGKHKTIGNIPDSPKNLYLDEEPTIGYAPRGARVGTPQGTWENVFELSTLVTAEVAALATSVTVDDITNTQPTGDIADDDVVGIALDDGTTHWDTVSGLVGNIFTISALTSPIGTVGAKALAGAHVVFNRWRREGKVLVNNQTGTTYTLQPSDNNKLVTLNNAAAITLTIPVLPAGFNCDIEQAGAGVVTLSPSGTTLRSRGALLDTNGQFAEVSIKSIGTSTYLISGDRV